MSRATVTPIPSCGTKRHSARFMESTKRVGVRQLSNAGKAATLSAKCLNMRNSRVLLLRRPKLRQEIACCEHSREDRWFVGGLRWSRLARRLIPEQLGPRRVSPRHLSQEQTVPLAT